MKPLARWKPLSAEPPAAANGMSGEKGASPRVRQGRGPLGVVLLVLALVIAVRVRLADMPLQRDEGEYAYAGQLILEGVPPYRLAYNMKFPGTYYAYAAILAVLGSSPRGIHLGLLVVNAATVLAVFLLGKRLMGGFAGAIAAGAFAFLSLDSAIPGVSAHATHFVILPAVAGLLLLERSIETGGGASLVGSGVLLGTAVLMKQHAVFFLPLGAGLLLWNDLRTRTRSVRGACVRIGLLAAGAAIPIAVVAGVLLAQGVLDRFWFWTFRYAGEYVTELPASLALPKLRDGIAKVLPHAWPVWIAAAAGAASLASAAWTPRTRALLVGLLAASFLAVCPGFYFRPHYFVVMFPAVALLAGAAAASALRGLARHLSPAAAHAGIAGLALLAGGGYVVAERDYLFAIEPDELCRSHYAGNPFVESVEIARYVRERTSPDDLIAVLGSEPQIYFYSGRRSATGYIYTYALMEPQRYAARMQDEMIREIEGARPRFIVWAEISASWLPRPDSEQRILDWGRRYLAERYVLVGVVDVVSAERSEVVWDAAVRSYKPQSPRLVYTFRRRDASGREPGAVSGTSTPPG